MKAEERHPPHVDYVSGEAHSGNTRGACDKFRIAGGSKKLRGRGLGCDTVRGTCTDP